MISQPAVPSVMEFIDLRPEHRGVTPDVKPAQTEPSL